MVDIYAVNGHAGDLYCPEPYAGDVHCLFADPATMAEFVDEWRHHVTGELTADLLEADHHALVHEQNAARVAAVITCWLNAP